MDTKEKKEIISKFKDWFKELTEKHKENTIKCEDANEFDINPFLMLYLSNYLEGNSEYSSIAKALLYPRILGTSITTSFGSRIQSFVTKVLNAYGSPIKGIDIEFYDEIDQRKKYCQLKSGPNSINSDDVNTVSDHFKDARNVARKNQSGIGVNDFVFCLIYGEHKDINGFIQKIEKNYNVYVGEEFWHRFTGDDKFYDDIIKASGQVAAEMDMKSLVEKTIKSLSSSLESKFPNLE